MNSQDILQYWGSKMDVRLDSSEYHDYELAKNEGDFNRSVLNFNKEINYGELRVNTTMLADAACRRDTVKLVEFDNRHNDELSDYMGLSVVLSYLRFVTALGIDDIILNGNVFKYTSDAGVSHYFAINLFNEPQFLDERLSLTSEDEFISRLELVAQCAAELNGDCCPVDGIANAKPWAYQINHGRGDDLCDYAIDRRPKKGWTIDLVFNRENLHWMSGGVFYYLGVRGENDMLKYADNNLSFSFTADGRIKWAAVRYHGECDGNGNYVGQGVLEKGVTPQLCLDGTSQDFNITIVFDRYRHFTGECDLSNEGGWNDMINDPVTREEVLGEKWEREGHKRLGVLKIYLNGRPIYRKDDWEEVIPSTRGAQPFIQSWGGGTSGCDGYHYGSCCFNIKRIKYFDEPLGFVNVRHHYITTVKPLFGVKECTEACKDEINGLLP
jgi:hypothetical protein